MMSYFDGIVLIKAMSGANGPVASKEYVNTAIEQLPKGLVYRGAVNYYNDLPSSGVEVGDCYTVLYSGSSGTTPDGTEYAWGPVGGTNQWIDLGPDLSEYRKIVALPSANYRLYACSPGGQTYFEAKNSGAGSTEPSGNVVMIPTDGKLTVGTPTGDYHATTKKYVDDIIDATNDTSLIPVSANQTGKMKFVIANEADVATQYDGYMYLLI